MQKGSHRAFVSLDFSTFSRAGQFSLQFNIGRHRRATPPGNASSSRPCLTYTKVYRQLCKNRPQGNPDPQPFLFHQPDRDVAASSLAESRPFRSAIKQPRCLASSIHHCTPSCSPTLPRKVVASSRRKCRELKHGYEADIVDARINSPRRKKVREKSFVYRAPPFDSHPYHHRPLSLSFKSGQKATGNFYSPFSLSLELFLTR